MANETRKAWALIVHVMKESENEDSYLYRTKEYCVELIYVERIVIFELRILRDTSTGPRDHLKQANLFNPFCLNWIK